MRGREKTIQSILQTLTDARNGPVMHAQREARVPSINEIAAKKLNISSIKSGDPFPERGRRNE